MKKAISILVALSLLLSLGACAAQKPASRPQEVVSGGGIIEFSSSESGREPAVPESPPAVPQEDTPSYAPLPSSSQPSYSGSSISYPESSSGTVQKPESSSGSQSSAPESKAPSSKSEAPRPESSSRPEPSSQPEPSSASESSSPAGEGGGGAQSARPSGEEVRAVWFSYLDLWPMINGKSESAFTKSIEAAFDNVKEIGLNTVFAQVRPFGDALYDSAYFPASYVYTGTEGEIGSQPYDALAIMVKAARSRGLRIEAWLNPYRVCTSNKALASDNPAREMLETGDALRYNGGIYYNPGSPAARELILDGVREIVDNYDVDGIHFDDYFYPPNATADFDAETYAAADTGKGLADWRREQVDILVRQVYQAVGRDKVFGISPTGNNANNYNVLFCNVEKWVTTPGYVDYICPQIYYGFNNTIRPYKATVQEFDDLITQSGVALYIGLAACNIGGGQNSGAEWSGSTDMMARQVDCARDAAHYSGFALYRYDSLWNPDGSVASAVKKEIRNLRDIM